MQNKKSWGYIGDAFMMYGTGVALEKGFNIGASLLKNTSTSSRFFLSAQTADEANAILVTQNPLTRPPYATGTSVVDQVTTSTEKFVRVFTKDVTTAEGKWVMSASEVKGLSPEQIQNKFALPNTPTHMVDVVVPKGASIRTSIAGKLDGWGNGGGVQTELMER